MGRSRDTRGGLHEVKIAVNGIGSNVLYVEKSSILYGSFYVN